MCDSREPPDLCRRLKTLPPRTAPKAYPYLGMQSNPSSVDSPCERNERSHADAKAKKKGGGSTSTSREDEVTPRDVLQLNSNLAGFLSTVSCSW